MALLGRKAVHLSQRVQHVSAAEWQILYLTYISFYSLLISNAMSKHHLSTTAKRWRRIVATLVVLLLVLLGGASQYLLHYSLYPATTQGHSISARIDTVFHSYPQLRPWVDSLMSHHALRDTFVVMPTGERHHALYIPAARPSRRVALLVHGYGEDGVWMLPLATIYTRMGYNVLLPDLHGHGRSEGRGAQMGWKDREDVMRWMDVANRRFGRGQDTQMVLHGVSMGAATVMCVSGENLPPYVRCFVEDCGYTSVWDEFSEQLRTQFGLPEVPLLYTASALCRLEQGWSFGQASPLRQVARCHRPMLFIHGDRDTYVPFAMLGRLYAAKPWPKAKWVAQGSVHARSFRDHTEAYTARVAHFVGRYIH